MLRLYLLQNLYDLSDEATAAEAIDSRAFSDFCGIDSSNQGPDGDTLGRFRNLLIKNGLQEKLFSQVVAALMERGLILKKGTIVDSTIISAPSSTKNSEKKQDPDAHQVKKAIPGTSVIRHISVLTRTADWFIPWRRHQPTSMMSQKHQSCRPEKKRSFTVIAVISVRENMMMRSSATRLAAKSNTESIAGHPK